MAASMRRGASSVSARSLALRHEADCRYAFSISSASPGRGLVHGQSRFTSKAQQYPQMGQTPGVGSLRMYCMRVNPFMGGAISVRAALITASPWEYGLEGHIDLLVDMYAEG